MGLFASLSDATVVDGVAISGTVSNIIVADSLLAAEATSGGPCVEYTDNEKFNLAHIGLTYENGVFEQPPAFVHELVDPSQFPNQQQVLIEE